MLKWAKAIWIISIVTICRRSNIISKLAGSR
jgi:hypothetical protein